MCIINSEEVNQVEVTCSVSGKIWRFAAGTHAGDAVKSINLRLKKVGQRVLCIEAVKGCDERVITYGNNSVLVNYGTDSWKLKTVTGVDYSAINVLKIILTALAAIMTITRIETIDFVLVTWICCTATFIYADSGANQMFNIPGPERWPEPIQVTLIGIVVIVLLFITAYVLIVIIAATTHLFPIVMRLIENHIHP